LRLVGEVVDDAIRVILVGLIKGERTKVEAVVAAAAQAAHMVGDH
jgi:hypothetical protein